MPKEKDFTVIEWNYTNCIRGKLVNLPDANVPIFFQANSHYFAGSFMCDDDSWGFYVNSGDSQEESLVLAEEVTKWAYIK